MTDPITQFLINNPNAQRDEKLSDLTHSVIKKPWGDPSVFFDVTHGDALDWLGNIYLPNQLVAIEHIADGKIEFIYTYLEDADYQKALREFNFIYNGKVYKCQYGPPSDALMKLAKFAREDSDISSTGYRNIRMFRDSQMIDTMPEFYKDFFSTRKPISFFVIGDLSEIKRNYIKFAKTFNFFYNFTIRDSPHLVVVEHCDKEIHTKIPCPNGGKDHPASINGKPIDPILLDILETARKTDDVRLQFIFYFQVLEYCSYYYLKEEIKIRIGNILSNPDINSRSRHYGQTLIEEMKDHFNVKDDKQKIEAIFNSLIAKSDIECEITEYLDYLKAKQKFDGGFTIDPIVPVTAKGIQDCSNGLIGDIKDNIVDIRNALVHLRESRENKVILPTLKNDDLLKPYLYLLRRISEYVAIRFDAA